MKLLPSLALLPLPLAACPGPSGTTPDTAPACTPGAVSVEQGIPMASICAGGFTMGSPVEEAGRYPGETQHEVALTHGFVLGVHELTQAEFVAFAGYQPACHDGCGDCPVECITWHEAAAFTNAVSQAAGLESCYTCAGAGSEVTCTPTGSPYDCDGYRLPTEAEWEYAARAGTTTAFSNGGNLYIEDEYDCDGDLWLDNGTRLDDIAAWCPRLWSDDDALHRPASVEGREPNPWGLYDMHGNVDEWCNDWYAGLDPDVETVAVDPAGPDTGTQRVWRGGSWTFYPFAMRSANRYAYYPTWASDFVGSRLARTE